ncbi:hypothetical protein M9H77_22345 [Catharanthus roseus]|uniref:Uncharacterized protein n=1 Tax=Catharanthus roseus TaxID=4058 RepID=A0ACC0ARF7_CATRO|nr:hypothetical protein M9H77_22345 [Catharanthus roseus]
MIEEFPKVNEFPQATIEVEESVILHDKEEISNVEDCGLMRDKNNEKESIEIKEKDRVEEKERLVERLCVFDSMSSLFEKCEKMSVRKKKKVMLRRSKEEEQKQKEVVALEKSEVMIDLLIKLTLFLLVILHVISLEVSVLANNYTMELEDQEECVEKELILCHENSSIISYVDLKLFLKSYISHKLFLSSFILNIFEGTSFIWKLELLPNFIFLILKALPNLSFQFHRPFKDIVEYVVNMCHLQDFYIFTYAFIGRSLVNFECFLHSPSLSNLI